MTSPLTAIALVLSAVIVLGSGVVLTRLGSPYGTALLNLHKLVDLAAVVVIAVLVYQANRSVAFSLPEWVLMVVTGLVVIATFAGGGMVSASRKAPLWVLRSHRISSWLAVALAAVSVYVSANRG